MGSTSINAGTLVLVIYLSLVRGERETGGGGWENSLEIVTLSLLSCTVVVMLLQASFYRTKTNDFNLC